jgi:hypothetical protein
MENFLDIRTLSVITSVVSVFIFFMMLSIAVKKKAYPGYFEWTIAALSNSLGMILLGMRNILPDFITIIISNILILLYLTFNARGLERFSNSKQKTWFDISVIIILTGTFCIFTYLYPNVNMRIIIISGLISLCCFRCCYIVWRKLPAVLNEKQILLFSAFAFLGLWHFSRVIMTGLFEDQISDFMSAGIIQALAFVSIIIGAITIGMMFLIINAERFALDLTHARKEIKTLSGLLPICSSCKKIRTDKGEWQHIENYVNSHSEALFTHGICPECQKKLYPEFEEE